MLDEGTLRERFPEIAWDQPVLVTIEGYLSSHSHWVCRYCIAMHGVAAIDLIQERVPEMAYALRRLALDHIEREHHDLLAANRRPTAVAAMSFEPSLVRRALDELLRRYPHFDLVSIDWQIERLPPEVINPEHPLAHQGPWVLVTLGQPSDLFGTHPVWAEWPFAIWKSTGALHSMSDGAVSDDPIWTP